MKTLQIDIKGQLVDETAERSKCSKVVKAAATGLVAGDQEPWCLLSREAQHEGERCLFGHALSMGSFFDPEPRDEALEWRDIRARGGYPSVH